MIGGGGGRRGLKIKTRKTLREPAISAYLFIRLLKRNRTLCQVQSSHRVLAPYQLFSITNPPRSFFPPLAVPALPQTQTHALGTFLPKTHLSRHSGIPTPCLVGWKKVYPRAEKGEVEEEKRGRGDQRWGSGGGGGGGR